MIRDLPPLTWLRAFEAAARTLSFTHAGAELHLTQAAVSKHVKALEDHLGQALFVRRARGLDLTRAGAAYVPKVADALERLALGTREVFGRRPPGALTLRATVAFATAWLAPRLPRFLDAHPGLPLRLLASVWNEPPAPGDVDLDIRYGTGRWPGEPSRRLTWETIAPVCAPGRRPATPDALADHRLLHVLGYHEGWGTWLQAAGARGVDAGAGLHLDTSLAAFELAAQGAGVALGRRSLVGPALASGRLVEPFDLAVPIEEGFHLVRPIRGGHPDADLLADWLLAEAARDAPPG